MEDARNELLKELEIIQTLAKQQAAKEVNEQSNRDAQEHEAKQRKVNEAKDQATRERNEHTYEKQEAVMYHMIT